MTVKYGTKSIHLQSHGISIKFCAREIGSSLLDLLGSNMHDRSLKIGVLTELFQSLCLLFQLLPIRRLRKLIEVITSTLSCDILSRDKSFLGLHSY